MVCAGLEWYVPQPRALDLHQTARPCFPCLILPWYSRHIVRCRARRVGPLPRHLRTGTSGPTRLLPAHTTDAQCATRRGQQPEYRTLHSRSVPSPPPHAQSIIASSSAHRPSVDSESQAVHSDALYPMQPMWIHANHGGIGTGIQGSGVDRCYRYIRHNKVKRHANLKTLDTTTMDKKRGHA